ncbi:hypothetical protein ACIRSU_26665 [Streptomyces sp. NPDC101160]|uniref:hypothetical protein n=1 Tax=Streptomyces sp. NPDC101160 TaxID=3366118 RepID=UPI0038073090
MHEKAPRGTFRKTRYILEDEFVAQNHLAAALLRHVDPRLGLLRTDFDRLADWAAAL